MLYCWQTTDESDSSTYKIKSDFRQAQKSFPSMVKCKNDSFSLKEPGHRKTIPGFVQYIDFFNMLIVFAFDIHGLGKSTNFKWKGSNDVQMEIFEEEAKIKNKIFFGKTWYGVIHLFLGLFMAIF